MAVRAALCKFSEVLLPQTGNGWLSSSWTTSLSRHLHANFTSVLAEQRFYFPCFRDIARASRAYGALHLCMHPGSRAFYARPARNAAATKPSSSLFLVKIEIRAAISNMLRLILDPWNAIKFYFFKQKILTQNLIYFFYKTKLLLRASIFIK